MIVNQSLTSGEFLDNWKMAIVRPLIKGPNLDTELKNYRPISNLSFLLKIVEKAAQLQLQEHFDQHSLLPKHQSAYRQHHSTETTLLNICDKILKNMEHAKCTSIVSLDLSAAFNTVNHTILLEVLNCYFGITEHALSWISSYLSSRRFQVQVRHLTSKTVEIDSSVPQGSILGPILFNCYAITLMEIILERKDSFLSGYADDHVIIHSFYPDDNNINQIIENDIGKIKTWMEDNQLKMNDAKTEFIVIGMSGSLRKNTLDHIKIGNTKIQRSSNIKYLGINLDEKLSFKDHIWNRSKKANYNLKLIRSIQKYIDIDSTKMLLCTLVLSQLDYANSLLSRTPKTIIKPYQTVQNFATRVAYKKSRREDVIMCLQQLHWLPVKYRTVFMLLTVAYNAVHRKAPNYLTEKLRKKEYHRTTRQSSSIGITLDVPPNKKKSFAARGFGYAAAKYWNDIPDNIKTAKDIKNFKSLLKTHFFRKAYQ